jgi:putative FmdB family regulatory protein
MPFYEYECRACGELTEVLQKVSDPPLRKCPECGKNQLSKLVSAPVFRLKGGGWYETDFKSDSEKKRNLAGADKEESASSDEGKGEKKTEAAKGEGKAAERVSKPRPVSRKVAKPARAAKPVKAAAKKAPRRATAGKRR